ncbi:MULTISPECIES: DNA repair protein RecN [Aphanizomenon]|jgi:DNA repair protein RecN (Recombination protein N)|uniref:DNA repair protein RecN n=1 Tax=Aphanizomenon flos-aquae FACHB-1249 TaxID=2692889 RepID=A0ABR8IKL8_APHFL|nr:MULTISPECIES: DNA repair protein RecN [Aphanizomenon]MBD2391124.1 DNA repair protein RecN [Aphanizomenon flos-aquae FACHB-1171]MBD2556445.1 DNA repair protein RecN [Aphanizomenon flos-aquae FACHB-1290]MBD2630126.1 DNA repair protein RecN [Aphanizomenon sp. FACHB-1399]MBD2641359.1 DNA repair protein RecN [Aphanizomenon sp. FACHB-1401]MBD2657761.1 DNA repair protein RecN [Aphanizomenon flos-aquae FACHB-1265]
MLLYLRIENFALIDHLELDFGAGLNVLTGETGAGKSIILDAIDAVLGGKVSSRVIRTGTNRAIVEATFSVTPPLTAWLNEQEIDLTDDHVVIISREIATTISNIRSRSRVNGVLVNRPLMGGLRDHLVEITAQGQTVQVGQSAQVRDWLDLYGGDALLQKRQNVAAAFIIYQQARQALEKRRTSERERLQQLDLLTYQVQELGAANLNDTQEMEQLNQERDRLNHVVDLQQMSYKVYQALYQDDQETRTAADLLADGEMILTQMVEYDSQLQSLLELVRDAVAAVMQVGRQINIYGEGLEADPQRLEEVEERIRELKQICRKYGPTLTEAMAYYERIQTELNQLNTSEQSIETLEQQEQLSLQTLHQISQELTQLRRQTAANLESQLLAELKPLAMDKVKFQIEIIPISPSSTGADKITFMFSPNPGEPIQPLTEIASGGEMSRFLLALKACFHQGNEVGTMIFDEIDVGVSGRVAQAIAEKLHQLSQEHQVLCVTHQPLIAAMADHHFRVDKLVINKVINSDDEQRTVVRVTSLNNLTTRREELAQLAGGKSANEAISFAESLLLQAANHRERGK